MSIAERLAAEFDRIRDMPEYEQLMARPFYPEDYDEQAALDLLAELQDIRSLDELNAEWDAYQESLRLEMMAKKG